MGHGNARGISFKAGIQMISDPAYNEAHIHREGAPADSALLASTTITSRINRNRDSSG